MDRREWLRSSAGALVAASLPLSAEPGRPRLVGGPMLGAPAPDSIRVWVQGAAGHEVALEVADDSGRSQRLSAARRLSADEGFAAVLKVEGLEPDHDYRYQVLIDGVPDPYLGSLLPMRTRTAPAPGSATAFTLAMGSCVRYADDPVQAIWPAVLAARPDLFLWLGDNVYGETLRPETLDREYRRQRAVPGFQPVARSVPQIAIWDDHDFGLNDSDRSSPLREQSLATFRRYWANPAYGEGDGGIYFQQRYGAVDLFCLDNRYWRDANDAPNGPDKTMLGRRQMEWLRDSLKASAAVFKVLACGSGWSLAKGQGGDSWAAFVHERDALFDFIRDEGIEGVVLVSGDTHVGELNVMPWSERGGYDLYDLVTSPLAQRTSDSWLRRNPEQRVRPVYFRSSNFGWLRFEFGSRPMLRFSVVDPAGRFAWKPLDLYADQLRNGVSSWRDLTDPSLLPQSA